MDFSIIFGSIKGLTNDVHFMRNRNSHVIAIYSSMPQYAIDYDIQYYRMKEADGLKWQRKYRIEF